jgi:hypothetical protein
VRRRKHDGLGDYYVVVSVDVANDFAWCIHPEHPQHPCDYEREYLDLDLAHPESVDAGLRFLATRHLPVEDDVKWDSRLPPAWWYDMGFSAGAITGHPHSGAKPGWVLEDPAGGASWTFETDETDAIKALALALRAEA